MTGPLLVLLVLLGTSAAQVLFKHHHVSGRNSSLVLAVGLFVAVVPFSYLAVRQVGVAAFFIFMSLSYGIVTLLGWKIFGERVTRLQVIGVATVMLGCLVYNL